MGRDIHMHLVKFNREKNEYEEVKLYRKSEDGTCYEIEVYPSRDYELFDILNGNDDDYFPCRSVHIENLPSSLVEEIKKDKSALGYYDFNEANLADIKIYLKEHPKVRDWDYHCEDENKEVWKDNPVKSLVKRIDYYVDFESKYYWDYMDSDIRLIYWFDC